MSTRHNLSGKTFSILGDSYSTFRGYIPEGYQYYYPAPHDVKDVLRVEDTWWCQLAGEENMRLLVNNSFSGSTVCTEVREEQSPAVSFVARSRECPLTQNSAETPDYILIFGCTNDCWLGRTLGQTQFQDWTSEDLRMVLNAYCYVLDQLTKRYPTATSVTVINDELDSAMKTGLLQAGAHYGSICVPLENIEKQNGHPTAAGMKRIAHQIRSCLY